MLKSVPGGQSIGGDGTLPIPAGIPETVQKVIAGANEIADFPYVFGGGHGSFVDNAYDCSGSVSYALAAAGLLGSPETSGELEHWGKPGPGRYITVFANAGHTYAAQRRDPAATPHAVAAPSALAGGFDDNHSPVRHWPRGPRKFSRLAPPGLPPPWRRRRGDFGRGKPAVKKRPSREV